MNAALSFLGLIKRAGKLTIGEESVKIEARSNRAKLIVLASDCGETLRKHGENLARMAKCALLTMPYTKAQLGDMLGRGAPGLLAVTDRGMAEALRDKIEKETNI